MVCMGVMVGCASADRKEESPKTADSTYTSAAPPQTAEKESTNNEAVSGLAKAKVNANAALAEESAQSATTQKIIHTAIIHGTVQDIYKTTSDLENAARTAGGWVAESRLSHSTQRESETALSKDSVRRYRIYSSNSFIELRVPAARFDTFVAQIPSYLTFLVSRSITQTDNSFQFLANNLKNQATQTRHIKRLTKSDDEGYEDQKAETIVDRNVENLRINQQVRFATVYLYLAQSEQLAAGNYPNLDAKTTLPYGKRLSTAFVSGFDFFARLFLFLTEIWPMYIILLFGLAIWRVWQRNRNSAVGHLRHNSHGLHGRNSNIDIV